MDHLQGIAAEVISSGQVLDFYEDPDAAGMKRNVRVISCRMGDDPITTNLRLGAME